MYSAVATLLAASEHNDYNKFAIEEPMLCIVDIMWIIANMLNRYAAAAEDNPGTFIKPELTFRSYDGDWPPSLSKDGLLSIEDASRHARSFSNVLKSMALAVESARDIAMDIPTCGYCRRTESHECSAEIPEQNSGKTALYRWFDLNDNLLYIGVTGALATRQNSHFKRSSWAEFAASSTIEWITGRRNAELREKEAIVKEMPLFNSVHNETQDARNRLTNYLVSKGRADLLQPLISRG